MDKISVILISHLATLPTAKNSVCDGFGFVCFLRGSNKELKYIFLISTKMQHDIFYAHFMVFSKLLVSGA